MANKYYTTSNNKSMNSPFTREEQAFARSVERISRVLERIADALEQLNEVGVKTAQSENSAPIVANNIKLVDADTLAPQILAERAEEVTGIKNDPELQEEINQKLQSAFKVVPSIKQYIDIKAKNPDALALIREGYFYKTYEEDAVEVSQILELSLMQTCNKIKMTCLPAHLLESYLPKLIGAGKKVAICENEDK